MTGHLDLLDLLPVATSAIDLAAEFLRTHRPTVVTSKGDRDMATEVDFAIERQMRAFLQHHTPHIGFLGEEEGPTNARGDLMWALDPVDGTANFIHGSPLCGVSLGLVREGLPVLGVLDFPFLGDCYTAVQGKGARSGDKPIQASTTSGLREAIVTVGDFAFGDGADSKNDLRLNILQRLAGEVQRVRMHGSAAIDLAWLAQGRVDAVIILSNNPWDTAAGTIIAKESGARIMDLDGTPHTMNSAVTIGTAPGIHAEIQRLLQEMTGIPPEPYRTGS